MKKFAKLIGALIGSATAPAVIGYLQLLGIHVPEDVVATALPLLVTVLSALGVYAAPKNSGTDSVQTIPVIVQPEPDERATVAPPTA